MRTKDLGVSILARFYVFLIFLYVLPLFVFATRLNICGMILSTTITFVINVLFMGFLWFLYTQIKNLKRVGFWAALVFHTFFIGNSIFMVMERPPLLMIEGAKPVTSAWLKPILFASIIVNLGIVAYLLYRKQLFFRRKDAVPN